MGVSLVHGSYLSIGSLHIFTSDSLNPNQTNLNSGFEIELHQTLCDLIMVSTSISLVL